MEMFVSFRSAHQQFWTEGLCHAQSCHGLPQARAAQRQRGLWLADWLLPGPCPCLDNGCLCHFHYDVCLSVCLCTHACSWQPSLKVFSQSPLHQGTVRLWYTWVMLFLSATVLHSAWGRQSEVYMGLCLNRFCLGAYEWVLHGDIWVKSSLGDLNKILYAGYLSKFCSGISHWFLPHGDTWANCWCGWRPWWIQLGDIWVNLSQGYQGVTSTWRYM